MSNIDLVLLGLIKQKSQSAYDIKKNIEYRNIPRWVKISEQSIYKKVLQLESKEYIVSYKEKEGNMPDKAIYTITNKGNDYFNKLMNDISNSDVSLYLDFNVIITNLDLVDDEQKQILVSNKSKILELKELLNERRSHRQHIHNIWKQMFKQQLALVETLEKWIIDLRIV
ncbi:MAG: PadR family transcriptional regulator [Clostridia bacterium]